MILHGIKIYKSQKYTNITDFSYGTFKKDIIGKENSILFGNGTWAKKLLIRIRGNNNTLEIEEDCFFGKGCSIWMEGNNITIKIGKRSTFTELCQINAQENCSSIMIGEDCMMSNNIVIRSSDSHPIYDTTTGERINNPENIKIGNHVWIAPNTKIMKGAIIQDGSIVGSDSTVSREFKEDNVLIIGRPAKIIKSNVKWTREKLF